jgi:hypothetical protein
MKTLLMLAATLLLSIACQPTQHAGNGIQYHYIQRTPVHLEMYQPSLYFPPVAPPQPLVLQPIPQQQLQLTPIQVRIVP